MIKYKDGEFLDLMPVFFKSKEDVAAISYAFKMAMQQLLVSAEQTRLYGDLDKQSEEVLDLMALEIQAPFYEDDLPIEKKRELIRKALVWRFKAGTKQSVRELSQLIFGEDSDVVEWFDFTDGEKIPGQFDIVTDAQLTPELFDQFSRTIESVKNQSAHLRRIGVNRTVQQRICGAVSMESHSRTVIGQVIDGRATIRRTASATAAIDQRNRSVIVTRRTA